MDRKQLLILWNQLVAPSKESDIIAQWTPEESADKLYQQALHKTGLWRKTELPALIAPMGLTLGSIGAIISAPFLPPRFRKWAGLGGTILLGGIPVSIALGRLIRKRYGHQMEQLRKDVSEFIAQRYRAHNVKISPQEIYESTWGAKSISDYNFKIRKGS